MFLLLSLSLPFPLFIFRFLSDSFFHFFHSILFFYLLSLYEFFSIFSEIFLSFSPPFFHQHIFSWFFSFLLLSIFLQFSFHLLIPSCNIFLLCASRSPFLPCPVTQADSRGRHNWRSSAARWEPIGKTRGFTVLGSGVAGGQLERASWVTPQ